MSLPRHALNLALSRLVVCALLVGSSEVLEAPRWAEQGRVVRAPPAGLGWALPWLDAGAAWVPAIRALCVASAVLAALGWRPRLTLGVAAASATLLFALPHFSGIPRHSMHLVWLIVLLAASPVGLGWSWSRAGAGRGFHSSAAADALATRVSLATAWGLLAAIYFFPGLWKLRESGLGWIFSDNLQNQMYWKWYQTGAVPAWRIDRHPGLVELGALCVVLFELGFPLLLWRRGTRACAAALGLAFHWAADAFLFLPFTALSGAYVVLVDWEWLLAWLRDEALPEPRPTLAARLRAFATGLRHDAHLRLLAAAALVLLGGAWSAGALGAMHAYPFACYPTFQWRPGVLMPDLWIELVGAGPPRWLAEGPAFGGERAQPRWGVAWRAAGVYGDAVTVERLAAYYQTLPAALRAERRPGERVRFYRARVDVRPEARSRPPASLELLGEWSPASDAAPPPLNDAAPPP
jgi:hypothetical protein